MTIPVVISLIIVFIAQVFSLYHFDQRIDKTHQLIHENESKRESAASDLRRRVTQLERLAGNTINTAEVAEVATRSIYKVVAKGGTGTAFAFGREPSGGGTDMITCFHVIKNTHDSGVKNVYIERDNRRFTAEITRVDEKRDLAVLHVAESIPRLQATQSEVKPGEPIVVVGAPLGIESVVTSGVVSSIRDTAEGKTIQFDAAINPGNSGGPVINAQKMVVGVATAKIVNAENVGLAIPITVVCTIFGGC